VGACLGGCIDSVMQSCRLQSYHMQRRLHNHLCGKEGGRGMGKVPTQTWRGMC
jgi:hypothetical protein